MKKCTKSFVAVLSVMVMVFAAIPYVDSGESQALTPDNTLGLVNDSVIVYVDSTSTNHSCTVTVNTSTIPAGYSASDIVWSLVDLDDGTNIVSFSGTSNLYTATGGSVTVYGCSPGTVEILASIPNTAYVASGVVVVFASEGTAADEFNFFIQIQGGWENYSDFDGTDAPEGKSFSEGFWINVTQSQTGLIDSEFNAYSALQWYCEDNDWNLTGSGWIESFLGLGTYPGDNGVWYYWAQYHVATNQNGGLYWAFNNTTMDYITTVDSSYIGLIFWGSTSETATPGTPALP